MKKKIRKIVAALVAEQKDALVAALNTEAERWDENAKSEVNFGSYAIQGRCLARRDAYRDAVELVTKHLA